MLGIPLDLSLCVLAASSVVLVVTVLLSDGNVDCEVVFFDADCAFVEPQSFLFSRKAKQVWLWSLRRKRLWRQKTYIPRGLRANECSSTRWNDTWRKVKVSKWKSPRWSITCLDQKMQTSASSRSQKVPEMKVVESSYCLTLKEEVEELRWLMLCVYQLSRSSMDCSRKSGAPSAGRDQRQNSDKVWEFDAVYAWTSRDRVIIERISTYLAGEAERLR